MGSPQNLSDQQRIELENAGQLAMFDKPDSIRVEQGKAALKFTLSRQAVNIILIDW